MLSTGQDVADENFLVLVINEGNKSILVATNIEGSKVFGLISRRKNLADIHKALLFSPFSQLVPS